MGRSPLILSFPGSTNTQGYSFRIPSCKHRYLHSDIRTHSNTLSGYPLANTDTLAVISEHTAILIQNTFLQTQIPVQSCQSKNTQGYVFRIPT